jgi:hypothetical protein
LMITIGPHWGSLASSLSFSRFTFFQTHWALMPLVPLFSIVIRLWPFPPSPPLFYIG